MSFGSASRLTLTSITGGAAGLASIYVVALLVDALLGNQGTSNSTDTWFSLAVATVGIAACALLWPRPLPRAFFLTWVGVTLALAAAVTDSILAGIVVVPIVFSLLFLDVPPQLRLAATIPALILFAVVAGSAADELTAYSGLALALLLTGYFVVWAVREQVPWGRHTAWACGLAWSLLWAIVTLGDALSVGGGLDFASLALTATLAVAVAVAWPLHARHVAPAQAA